MHPIFARLLFLATLLFSLPGALWAQSTDASIKGFVRTAKGEAVYNATVTVKNLSTGFTASTLSGKDGKYTFLQLPLGTPYSLKVEYQGYTTEVRENISVNQGDQLLFDFAMNVKVTQLDEVVVKPGLSNSRIDRLGSSTAISAQTIQQIPAQNRNFNNLVALAPTSNGGSLSGQRASSTNYTIDGLSARNNLTSGTVGGGPYSLSLEAIREFEVSTNIYDVTQGRSGGGNVSVVTKSGTNTFTGSVFDYYRADELASKYDIRGVRRNQQFLTNQYGFSIGGPIIKDKLHFFAALDRQNESTPFTIADIRSDDDANSLNISKGALDTLINIARTKYGVAKTPQTGEFGRKTLANTFFIRLDWQLNAKNRLTLRNNYSDWNNPHSNSDNSSINLYEVYGSYRTRENSSILSLRTQVSRTVLNELKVQYQTTLQKYDANEQLPAGNIPRAIVSVSSLLPNGKRGSTTVQIGGQRFTPESDVANQVQLVNSTYITKDKYTITVGTDNTLTYLDNYISNEQNGKFYFNSLQDFDNLNPYRYAREVPTHGLPTVQQYILNTSLFGQIQFTPWKNATLVTGLRWDVTDYLTRADYNPAVEQYLGLRTDARAKDFGMIQPRVQLTWDLHGDKTDIIRFGAGLFTVNPVNYAMLNNIQNSGTKIASIDISTPAGAGPNLVPKPDFVAYRNDPSTAPGLIAGAPTVSTINLNDPNVKMPRIYKTNFSYNKFITRRLRLGVNLLYAYTTNNYVYVDKNMVDQPFFTLANEGNRGVFVPASSITSKGITNSVLGRKTQNVGRVLQFTDAGKLSEASIVIDGSFNYYKDGYINFSYTWNSTKDNSSYNGNVANTSTFRPVKSDSRDFSQMYYSDNQFRTKIVVYGSLPSWKGFVLSGKFSGIGGTRYSLVVNADINGDFLGGTGSTNNDLAFVFNPNDPKTDPAVAKAMQTVLDNGQNRARDYIQKSIGKIADRNGGENPFYGTIDLRLAKTLHIYKTQALTLSVDCFNFANLLNKNWGGAYQLGNQNLLNVTGFDQTKQQYIYSVNQNVGVATKSGTPYQIQLGARYSF
ncbi:MAG: carboxypeptidase regulatory-like domain-containing protein [Bacteroidetes bacterium]|nr:carboxypeptidase regulatory-like domain-containing protein [Bacteroidota bacterium]